MGGTVRRNCPNSQGHLVVHPHEKPLEAAQEAHSPACCTGWREQGLDCAVGGPSPSSMTRAGRPEVPTVLQMNHLERLRMHFVPSARAPRLRGVAPLFLSMLALRPVANISIQIYAC